MTIFPALQRSAARIILILGFLASSASVGGATIRYTVSLEHPEQHTFRVSMEILDVAEEVTVQMPAWNALYQIRDFSAHLREVEAFAGSQKLSPEKIDKQKHEALGLCPVCGKGQVYVLQRAYVCENVVAQPSAWSLVVSTL